MLLGNSCYVIFNAPTPSNVHYMVKNRYAKFYAFVTFPAILWHFSTQHTPLLTWCSCVALALFKYHAFSSSQWPVGTYT